MHLEKNIDSMFINQEFCVHKLEDWNYLNKEDYIDSTKHKISIVGRCSKS
jgi:hypothetical protein